MPNILLPIPENNPMDMDYRKVHYNNKNIPVIQLSFHKKPGFITIEISNAFSVKDELKKMGFKYDNRIWYGNVRDMDILAKGLKKLSSITDMFYISRWTAQETLEFLNKNNISYTEYKI